LNTECHVRVGEPFIFVLQSFQIEGGKVRKVGWQEFNCIDNTTCAVFCISSVAKNKVFHYSPRSTSFIPDIESLGASEILQMLNHRFSKGNKKTYSKTRNCAEHIFKRRYRMKSL